MNISSFIEIQKVYIDWDFTASDDIEINGVWLEKPGVEPLDITDHLTAYELEQCCERVQEIVRKAADRAEAWYEERPKTIHPNSALQVGKRALKAEGVEL